MIGTLRLYDADTRLAESCVYDLPHHPVLEFHYHQGQPANITRANYKKRSLILCVRYQDDYVVKYREAKYFPNVENYIFRELHFSALIDLHQN